MSFDVNPPSRNFSNVQASQGSCPGGGGNTGYFRRGKKSEDDVDLKFAKDYPDDSFEKIELEEEPDESFLDFIKDLFKKFIENIKALFVKN